MLLAVVLCGIPLLVCIFLFNLVFNTRLGARSPVWSMAIGAAIAGVGSAFISGIIGEVWAIFVIMGGIIGYIAGATR